MDKSIPRRKVSRDQLTHLPEIHRMVAELYIANHQWDSYRDYTPFSRRQKGIKVNQEGVGISTVLRGFAFSAREALAALRQRFGSSEFYFRQALDECHVDLKTFAKLRADGVLVKISKRWPARWRIAFQYLTTTPESTLSQIHK